MTKAVIHWAYERVKGDPMWTVGFIDARGQWHAESLHTSQEAASDRCAYLNTTSKRQKQIHESLVRTIKIYCGMINQWRRTGVTPSFADFARLQELSMTVLFAAGEEVVSEEILGPTVRVDEGAGV